eukprot:159420-Pelagomonas_calceolata.AAC.1
MLKGLKVVGSDKCFDYLMSSVLQRMVCKHSIQICPLGRACIKERSPVLKGRAPPHRPRGRASTEVYSSKMAPTMGPTTQLSGRPCPASLRPPLSPKHSLGY